MISVFQAAVSSTPSAVAMMPPGPCTLTVSNPGTVTIYVGGPGVSVSDGYPVGGGSRPVTIPGFATAGGTAVWAVIAGTPPLLAATSSVPGVFDPGAAVPCSPGASGGDTAYLGITIQR